LIIAGIDNYYSMMQTPQNPNERIRVLIDHFTKGNAAAFARSIHVVQQGFDRLLKPDKKTGKFPFVKHEIVDKIVGQYPDVSKIWLLSGGGPMLLSMLLLDPIHTFHSEPSLDLLAGGQTERVSCNFYLPVDIDQKLKKISESSGKSCGQILSELIAQIDF